jgi:propionyl-CoA carboxylase alpha chain
MPSISTLLIANRGEIVSRIARSARALGLRTVGVYTDSDRDGSWLRDVDLAVCLGDDNAASPYLDIAALLTAASRTGATAVHPGYGFLAEDAKFAAAVVGAGLTWIGPAAEAIRMMGSKVEAKAVAEAAGIPVLAGIQIDDDLSTASQNAAAVGFPLLVKPSAGGGGKGMHVVTKPDDLLDVLSRARREAVSSFGTGALLVERYVPSGRHVEIQVFGDSFGNVVSLGERDCSVQRRHQKVIEEAPAFELRPDLKLEMADAAVRLARSIGYLGAGTVEFLVHEDGFAFLEMNTRLQVEHAVTEEVTGLDLVELQLLVAAGSRLPLGRSVRDDGHAVEVRLYAEDPARDFLPSPGRITGMELPQVAGVRWEVGVAVGSPVNSRYDPMIAKIIARGRDRARAVARLREALERFTIQGVRTNRRFLLAVLGDREFQDGPVGTDYLARRQDLLSEKTDPEVVVAHCTAAALHAALARRRDAVVQPFTPLGWRNLRSQDQQTVWVYEDQQMFVQYRLERDDTWVVKVDGDEHRTRLLALSDSFIDLELDGIRRHCTVVPSTDETVVESAQGQSIFRGVASTGSAHGTQSVGAAVAPIPGVVIAAPASPGDIVAAGDTLVILEAMKMEHRITASGAGVVARVHTTVGDSVEYRQVLVEVEMTSGE